MRGGEWRGGEWHLRTPSDHFWLLSCKGTEITFKSQRYHVILGVTNNNGRTIQLKPSTERMRWFQCNATINHLHKYDNTLVQYI